ncbi:Outer membrane protein and related peptidoglycan-associated protein [Candidatus Terasakiella magnetica]|nr:Outer membrane protein and related peptidoglycan-associated protein [Candidatus Terasakiella magnetica]
MRSFKTLIAAAIVASVPTLAQAQWYVGADVGAGFLQDSKNSGNGFNYKSSSDAGWLAIGEVGYAFGPMKLEAEISYRANGIDKVAGQNGKGDTSAIAPMVNGVYEFLPQSAIHPFVGAGIGAAYVNAGTVSQNGTNVYKGGDWQFAYQGFAGVGYDISQNVELKAQYRYFSTLDYKTKAIPGGQKLTSEYADHAILIGFNYKFGAPEAAPAPAPVPIVAPTPVPTPVVKPAAVQKNFMVFFDFDKAAITPEANRIIQQAAAAAKANSATRIDLSGHTDMAGSDKYNQALSQKRGNAVKDQLIAQGVPAAQIVVVAKGKSSPLVPTPDGVREPQNRRVEIILP